MSTQEPVGQPRVERVVPGRVPLADGDLRDWLAQLPVDDPASICDFASGRPVRWDETRGWIE